jgi:hypothetical protein
MNIEIDKPQVIKITDKIIRVNFKYQSTLCKTFLRFQEYYESPKFKDVIFTLGVFRKWYSEEFGGFTYYTDWDGFNLPSCVLKPFLMGLFDPLSKKEQTFLKLFPDSNGEPFYIIGTYGENDPITLKHEIAHAFYYLDKIYKTNIDRILKNNDLTDIFEYLKELGYHSSVFLDEVHAYILTDPDGLEEAEVKFPKITERLEKEYKLALQRCDARGI